MLFVASRLACKKIRKKVSIVEKLVENSDSRCPYPRDQRRNHRRVWHARTSLALPSSRPDRWYGGRTKIRRSIHVTITLTSQVGYSYRCTGAPMPSRHAMLRGTHEFSRDTSRKRQLPSCIASPSFAIAIKPNFLRTTLANLWLPNFPPATWFVELENCTGALSFLCTISYRIDTRNQFTCE